MIEKDLLTTGNAIKDGKRGWFVGQFVPRSFGLTHQHALEMKWGRHSKGEERRRFAKSRSATTISILINGSFITRLKLQDEIREVALISPGDYVAFGPCNLIEPCRLRHSFRSVSFCDRGDRDAGSANLIGSTLLSAAGPKVSL
jgi:hypothetical protein